MSDRSLRLVLAALATATLAIAAYLTQVHYAGGSAVCSTGGCETVQQSSYAEIFGIPVAVVGLVGSAAILLTLLRSDEVGRAACLATTVAGFLFAAYLVVVQLAVVGAVCEWCVANDSLLAVLAGLALLRARPDLRAPAPVSGPPRA